MVTIPWTMARDSSPTGEVAVQVSRLELARLRDVPGFLIAALRLRRSVLHSDGAVGLSLRAAPFRRTFWTLSAWNDQAAINAFTRSPAHRDVMVSYRDRMAGSHFHTWYDADPAELPPSWRDALDRLGEIRSDQRL